MKTLHSYSSDLDNERANLQIAVVSLLIQNCNNIDELLDNLAFSSARFYLELLERKCKEKWPGDYTIESNPASNRYKVQFPSEQYETFWRLKYG